MTKKEIAAYNQAVEDIFKEIRNIIREYNDCEQCSSCAFDIEYDWASDDEDCNRHSLLEKWEDRFIRKQSNLTKKPE